MRDRASDLKTCIAKFTKQRGGPKNIDFAYLDRQDWGDSECAIQGWELCRGAPFAQKPKGHQRDLHHAYRSIHWTMHGHIFQRCKTLVRFAWGPQERLFGQGLIPKLNILRGRSNRGAWLRACWNEIFMATYPNAFRTNKR
jgi:hypothetical protein